MRKVVVDKNLKGAELQEGNANIVEEKNCPNSLKTGCCRTMKSLS